MSTYLGLSCLTPLLPKRKCRNTVVVHYFEFNCGQPVSTRSMVSREFCLYMY